MSVASLLDVYREDPGGDRSIVVKYYPDGLHQANLQNYLEIICETDVIAVHIPADGCNVAIAVFRGDVNEKRIQKWQNNAFKKPLSGCYPTLELLGMCSGIYITGVPGGVSDDHIQLYFENEKSGGIEGGVEHVEQVDAGREKHAIIKLSNEQALRPILSRPDHQLKGTTIEICPFYPSVQRYILESLISRIIHKVPPIEAVSTSLADGATSERIVPLKSEQCSIAQEFTSSPIADATLQSARDGHIDYHANDGTADVRPLTIVDSDILIASEKIKSVNANPRPVQNVAAVKPILRQEHADGDLVDIKRTEQSKSPERKEPYSEIIPMSSLKINMLILGRFHTKHETQGVKITLNEQEKTVTIQAMSFDELKSVKIGMYDILDTIVAKTKKLSDNQFKFISRDQCQKYLKSRSEVRNMRIVFEINNQKSEILCHSFSDAEVDRGIQFLEAEISKITMHLNPGQETCLHSSAWNTLKKALDNNLTTVYQSELDQSIHVESFIESKAKEAEQKIIQYLKDNVSKKAGTVTLESAKARCFQSCFEDKLRREIQRGNGTFDVVEMSTNPLKLQISVKGEKSITDKLTKVVRQIWHEDVDFSKISSGACPPTVHAAITGFGPSCTYRCNCNNNAQCHNVTGECQGGCLHGWMGPGCQYHKFKGFRVETGHGVASSDFVTVCYEHADSPGTLHMEIMCRQPKWTRHLRIILAVRNYPLRLCEVEIYGGRQTSFNKDTTQSTTFNKFFPNHAVDGTFLPTTLPTSSTEDATMRTCSATDGTDRNPWWYVDLGTMFDVQDVYLYARRDKIQEQCTGYFISVGDMPNRYVKIFEDNPIANDDAYQPRQTALQTIYSGQYVKVDRRLDYGVLTICELYVFADCPMHKCGWNCSLVCRCNGVITGHMKITGVCPNGCMTGWTGENGRCDQGCWGEDCQHECGNCQHQPCDTSTGMCLDGCSGPWKPPACVNVCDNGTFGTSCSSTCGKCRYKEQCNVYTGSCMGLCEDGWLSQNCSIKCPNGTYGENCTSKCGNCSNNDVCVHTTGDCPDGCEPGIQPPSCQLACSNMTYGVNCSAKCGNCANGTECNTVDGVCEMGCQPGWTTNLCATVCEFGKYGDNCSEKCGQCLGDETCNHVTGNCTIGCTGGYMGSYCTHVCNDGYHGQGCSEKCGQCLDGATCNHTTGHCSACGPGYIGEQCTSKKHTEAQLESIVGVVVGLVLATGVVIAAVVLCHRSYKTGGKEQNGDVLISDSAIPEEEKHVEDAPDYTNTDASVDETSITIQHLRYVCNAARQDPTFLFREFQELPYGLKYDASDARNILYKPKNKYKDMHPYNANRVLLPEIQGEPGSTYINASYINGYDKPKKYIAAQGALESTVNDIWRMVWAEKISVIVMLTNCYELGKLKCDQYWPDERSNVYGDICIHLISTEEFSDFKVRNFNCTQIESGESRTVLHFHYTAWPDKDVPDTALSVVQFWRKVRGNKLAKYFPWMVHCSAGVGRTGTFIALDYLYEQGLSEGAVNVKAGVNTLRRQRLNMVQAKVQYVYLHEAVAEVLDPIGSVCHSEDFSALYKRLIPDRAAQALHDEYQSVCKATEMLSETTDDNVYYNTSTQPAGDPRLAENIGKCRNPDIFPDDIHRPRLGLTIEGRNDFINAVFISTFRERDRMILTQIPVEDTVVDFVRMIWEFNISTIVFLEEAAPDEDVAYWPINMTPKVIGPFNAELLCSKTEDCHTLRTIRYTLNKTNEQKEVQQFHFTDWPIDSKTPRNTRSMLRLLSDMKMIDTVTNSNTFVVQCHDGAKKSGLFCTLCCVLERMKSDSEVAIAETVRLVRLRRRQVIDNFEQYQFCYNTVRDYLEGYEVYANVL